MMAGRDMTQSLADYYQGSKEMKVR